MNTFARLIRRYVLATAAVLMLGAASAKTGLSAWKTQVGVRAALSLQDGRQLALQEAALTVYRPAVQAPEETPKANAAEKSAATPDNAPEPTTPEPTETALPEDAPPAEETGSETGTGEAAADVPAQPQALAAPMNAESNAESTATEQEVMGEAEAERTKADEPQLVQAAEPQQQPEALAPKSNAAETPNPLESAESQTKESEATEPPASEPAAPAPQAAAPEGTPVEVSQPEGLCAEYPEVTLQPGGWAEYQVILVNEGAVDAALPELEIPDLPEGVSCEGPELPESGLLRAGEGWTLTWIVHCEGESQAVAFSVTARLTQPPIAPAPSAAYTIAPGSGREEETP